MRGWPGEAIDQLGIVRILNPDGTRPPLVWCFNGQHEFPMLARGLGPDQPLIGIRSLHLVSRMEPGRALLDEAMGDHYAKILLDKLPSIHCFVGGNCQGVPIAAQVLRQWLLADRSCVSFIALEWEPGLPLPTPCILLFGDRSEIFNPYLRGDTDAPARWKLLFARPRHEIIPGSHGGYFSPECFGTLAAAVRNILQYAPEPLPLPPAVRLSHDPLPDSVVCGAELDPILSVNASAGRLPTGLAVCQIWRNVETGEATRVRAFSVHGADQISRRMILMAPRDPGLWDLILYPALPPEGPLSWREHATPAARVVVTEAA